MNRPPLHQIPLASVLPLGTGVGGLVITMSRRQWDHVLAESYEAGDVLLELDADEQPVAAFQKPSSGEGRAS